MQHFMLQLKWPSNQRNKSKIRISKSETNSETNKSHIGKIQNTESKEACLEFYIFWSFEIVSNFGFRASNFLFLAPLRLCARHGFSDVLFNSDFQVRLARFSPCLHFPAE